MLARRVAGVLAGAEDNSGRAMRRKMWLKEGWKVLRTLKKVDVLDVAEGDLEKQTQIDNEDAVELGSFPSWE